jgi:hypothetical protein
VSDFFLGVVFRRFDIDDASAALGAGSGRAGGGDPAEPDRY